MKHHEIDQYARQSPLAKFDPRIKLLSVIFFIASIALLHSIYPLLFSLLSLFIIVAISRIPPLHIAKSYLMAFPFVIFATLTMWYSSGLIEASAMFLRISNSVLALILLISTTPFFEFLKALQWYRLPKVMISLILFTYRFIFVFIDELGRMSLARKARGFGGGKSILNIEALRTIAYTAGMIFVRSHRRANNIYLALVSRGYTGEVRTLNMLKAAPRDAIFALTFICISVLSLLIQAGVMTWTL
ncbi:MAG: cobalt ECF transporter T component CbiQ [Methanomassiliicoccales archaeon]